MGRPGKKSPERLQSIIDDLASGNTLSATSALNAITPATLAQWRKQDPDFDAACLRAMAQAEAAAVASVRTAFLDDWKSAAWYLRHARRDQWHDRTEARVDVTSGGQPLQREVDWSRLSVEERRILLKALERQMDEDREAGLPELLSGEE